MLFYEPRWRAIDADGHAIAGAKLFCYQAGTSSTFKDTFYNVDLAIGHENSNPVIADSGGLFGPIYLSGSMKFVLKDADDIEIWSQDDVDAVTASDITYLERTVEAKLSEFISVKDYGAIGNGAVDDYAACQEAITTAAIAGGTVRFPWGLYSISATLAVPANVGIIAEQGAILSTWAGFDDGAIEFAEGDRAGFDTIPSISSFTTGFGLKLKGTNIANIKVHTISGCGDAIVIETKVATHASLLDSNIEFQHIAGCTRAIVFYADDLSNTIQGCVVRGNFVSNCNHTVAFEADGLADNPSWDSNSVILNACDPTPSRTTARMLTTDQLVDRFTFQVNDWCGGLDDTSNAKFLSGTFNTLRCYLSIANEPIDGQIEVQGTGNVIELRSLAGSDGTVYTCRLAANEKASFNSGASLYENRVNLGFALAGDVLDGAGVSAYLYHQLTDLNSCLFRVSPATSATMAGLTPIAIIDRSGTNADEIRVDFANYTGATIPSTTPVHFTLTVGIP